MTNGKTVLIVEEGELAQRIARLVEQESFDTLIASDYQSALKAASGWQLPVALAIVAADIGEHSPLFSAFRYFIFDMRKILPNLPILAVCPEGSWPDFSDLEGVTATQKTAAGYSDIVAALQKVK